MSKKPTFHAEIKTPDSEWVAAIQYDADLCVLDARLYTGDRYRYRDVSNYVFSRVITAPSVGRAFNTFVKAQHPHRKLPRKS